MNRFARGLTGWRLAGLGMAVLLGAFATSSRAADLRVSPVLMEYAPSQQAQALNLSNEGKTPFSAQVRVERWSQQDGKDRLEPADDVVASPAIVRLAPGQQQVVRLVRKHAVAPGTELSYRVLVDELPDKQAPAHTGVRILLRYSIPLFVAPASAVVVTGKAARRPLPPTDLSAVHARLAADGDAGKARLYVRNDGPIHLRVSHLVVDGAAGGVQVLADGLVGYVLPGQQMSWPVNVPYPLPAGQTLKAQFNDDREARPVPLDSAGR